MVTEVNFEEFELLSELVADFVDREDDCVEVDAFLIVLDRMGEIDEIEWLFVLNREVEVVEGV